MRHTINLATIAIIVLISAAASVSGQMTPQYRADIPFDFSIGNENLKAGTYSFGLFNRSSTLPVLGIMNTDSGKAMLIKPLTRSGYNDDTTPVLKFFRSGDRYDLAQVLAPDYDVKLRQTWSDVRQVTRNAGGKTETVSLHVYK